MLGMCLLGTGETKAQSSVQYGEAGAVEGTGISINYNLPSFPHEQRLTHPGYSGVRYKLYTTDGTATGQLNVPLFPTDGDINEDTDYIGVSGWPWTLQSNGNYSKTLVLTYNTRDDDRPEDDENFFLSLKEPEVLPAGSTTWESHGGSHHVPLEIKFVMNIHDND